MLQGKKILIGVTGSIAAYKVPMLVRMLIKAGAEVKVIMTKVAADFVSPLTLSTISKNEVISELSENNSWANHVMLGRWADVMLIAPLSCNTLAKMQAGACDNLLTAVYLSAICPVIVAPAMDEDMWKHPSTKRNLKAIAIWGIQAIPVGNGELASGLIGEGRMAEIETIYQCLDFHFDNQQELKGKRAIVTAGPTYESLDPVRFIGNHSSGKMGVAVANELKQRGADVTLILGPSSINIPAGIHVVRVRSAEEMYTACTDVFAEIDIAVMSAAVADYTPIKVMEEKIKKKEDSFSIELTKTKDILKYLGSIKTSKQILVGFALETNNEEANAKKKLEEKKADMIVLNSLQDIGAGFGHDTNKISIFNSGGNVVHYDMKSKTEVAVDIVNAIIKKI